MEQQVLCWLQDLLHGVMMINLGHTKWGVWCTYMWKPIKLVNLLRVSIFKAETYEKLHKMRMPLVCMEYFIYMFILWRLMNYLECMKDYDPMCRVSTNFCWWDWKLVIHFDKVDVMFLSFSDAYNIVVAIHIPNLRQNKHNQHFSWTI